MQIEDRGTPTHFLLDHQGFLQTTAPAVQYDLKESAEEGQVKWGRKKKERKKKQKETHRLSTIHQHLMIVQSAQCSKFGSAWRRRVGVEPYVARRSPKRATPAAGALPSFEVTTPTRTDLREVSQVFRENLFGFQRVETWPVKPGLYQVNVLAGDLGLEPAFKTSTRCVLKSCPLLSEPDGSGDSMPLMVLFIN